MPPSPAAALPRAPAPRLAEESMRAHDCAAIPGLPRPRPPLDARVQRWVGTPTPKSTARLVRLISARPAAGSEAARLLRRKLVLPADPGPALAQLDQLMALCPYFYRFVANARFFAALWALRKRPTVPPAARAHALLLVRAWAEDLARMFRPGSDAPAAFWVERYARKRRAVRFPDLPERDRPFVCRVPAPTPPADPKYAMGRERLDATLALLEKMLAAADDAPAWRQVATPAAGLAAEVRRAHAEVHDDDASHTLLLPPGESASPPDAAGAALNAKVIAVLRRYDESFARFDPYLSGARPGCPDVFEPGSSGSVAAVAREKARWKLSLSQTAADAEAAAGRAEGARRRARLLEAAPDGAVEWAPAVTPASFEALAFRPDGNKEGMSDRSESPVAVTSASTQSSGRVSRKLSRRGGIF